ncbi:hypothetical protein P8935_24230 [Telmatobacter sp. DSM 110680]|uniref:Tyr recombinase domain-containing protein n=1 Tax=Telmatobacter sp. DSM 110680 TaxID=3036704 RepID=A0AAU7DIJ0_9BACT
MGNGFDSPRIDLELDEDNKTRTVSDTGVDPWEVAFLTCAYHQDLTIIMHFAPDANRAGKAPDRHNLLHRHGLPKEIDFRSFRTMHASLVRRVGGRFEIARDNMGHAGSTGKVTLDVYSKTWWDERVEEVTRIVEAVFTEPDEERKEISAPLKAVGQGGGAVEWEPF